MQSERQPSTPCVGGWCEALCVLWSWGRSKSNTVLIMNIEGGCHCGKLTFSAEIDPEQVFICHCTDCQTLSGSAYRTVIPAIECSFKMLTGNPKIYFKTADNGSKRQQAFCSDCGTPIYSAPESKDSSLYIIRVGSIKQRNQLIPKSQIWCRSRQSWVQDLTNVTSFDTQ